jgi:hypothetical protein
MSPIKFPEANIVLKGPEGSDIMDLPAATDGKQCVSCWQLSWRERLNIVVTGRLWVYVLSGQTQPPIGLAVVEPGGFWSGVKALLPSSKEAWWTLGNAAFKLIKRYVQFKRSSQQVK